MKRRLLFFQAPPSSVVMFKQAHNDPELVSVDSRSQSYLGIDLVGFQITLWPNTLTAATKI